MKKKSGTLALLITGILAIEVCGQDAAAAEWPQNDVSLAVENVHAVLWGKFVGANGLIHDYVGEVPTPEDCALGKPNAIGWWSPIENGPMFTGLYLPAACERARRSGNPADKEQARRLAQGLLLCASVSDVPGFIARGTGSDGKCHYPLGSDDQTHPWFYGLHAYAMSGLPDAAERHRIVGKMCEVANVLEKTGWRCPCDGAFKGDFRGGFRGHLFRDAVRYLYLLRAMFDVTRDDIWLQRYRAALAERPEKSDITRVEICALGYPFDREAIPHIDETQLWIYVGSQGALAKLAEMETDEAFRKCYRAGLAVNATNAFAAVGTYRQFDNNDKKVFGHANWRAGYPEWFPQKTQEEALRLSRTGDKTRLGERKGYEVRFMRNPLAAAAIVVLAGGNFDRGEIGSAITHYEYEKLNMAECFFAECAYYAFVTGNVSSVSGGTPVGCDRQLFLDDHLVDAALTRDVTRTMNPPQDIRRVLKPDQPWETLGFIFYASVIDTGGALLLYYGSYSYDGKKVRHFCLAKSKDGFNWERPVLGMKAFNGSKENNLLPITSFDGAVFLDPHAPKEKRYRLLGAFGMEDPATGGVYVVSSPDGIHWVRGEERVLPFVPDSQHAAFWDERLQTYVAYLRAWDQDQRRREVCRVAMEDIEKPWPYDRSVPSYFVWGNDKTPTLCRELPIVLAADETDPENLDIYTSTAMPYPFAPNTYFAFPATYFKFKGPEWKSRAVSGNDGQFEVQFAASSNGISWNRWRQPYVAPGYHDGLDLRLVSMVHGMVRRGRWIHQYFIGWPHTHGRPDVWERDPENSAEWMKKDRGGIYVATQRLDGFVSMDSAYSGGILTTKPLTFTGNQLCLNLDTRGSGSAKVAILDADGTEIAGFAATDCEVINSDDTDHVIQWKKGSSVHALVGRPVRVQVTMRNTKLYAMQFVEEQKKGNRL